MCYFLIDTYIDVNKGRDLYNDYIQKVKPIVEHYGGVYLLRSERVLSLHSKRKPERVIIICFPSRDQLDACFNSAEYKNIMNERLECVDARALIVEEE